MDIGLGIKAQFHLNDAERAEVTGHLTSLYLGIPLLIQNVSYYYDVNNDCVSRAHTYIYMSQSLSCRSMNKSALCPCQRGCCKEPCHFLLACWSFVFVLGG